MGQVDQDLAIVVDGGDAIVQVLRGPDFLLCLVEAEQRLEAEALGLSLLPEALAGLAEQLLVQLARRPLLKSLRGRGVGTDGKLTSLRQVALRGLLPSGHHVSLLLLFSRL